MLKHGFVELAKLVFDKDRHVHIRRQFDRLIIGGLDPALARDRKDEQLLLAFRIYGAETNGQHEILVFISDLNWAQHG